MTLSFARDVRDILAECFAGRHIRAENLLPVLLPFAVEMRMLDLREQGGPSEAQWLRAAEFGKQAAEGPDLLQDDTFVPHPRLGLADGSDLLYLSQHGKGATATLFNELAYALAVMAFAPGGAHFMGMGWHGNAGEAGVCRRCCPSRCEEGR